MSRDVVEIVHDIKTQLGRKCGTQGLRLLGRAFVVNDTTNTCQFNFYSFSNIIAKAGIFLSRQEASKLYRFFDVNGDEHVDYREFIRGLVGEASPRRAALIEKAFVTLSGGAPSVPISRLVSAFTPEKHPRVVTGEFTAKEVFEEFCNSFENAAPGRSGLVSFQEWSDYYTDVSAVSPYDDDAFATAIAGCWGVREAAGASAAATAKVNKAVQGVRDLIATKIQQRSKSGGSETDTLRKCFKTYDLEDQGRLAEEAFYSALATFGIFLDATTKKQFFASVAVDGLVDYLAFTNSLFGEDDLFGPVAAATARAAAATGKAAAAAAGRPVRFEPSSSAALDIPAPNGVSVSYSSSASAATAGAGEFPLVVFPLGGPSSGKTMQADLLAARLGFAYVSTEEELAAQLDAPASAYAASIKQAVAAGKIVPVDVVVAVVRDAMEAHFRQGRLNFVVDGFPRSRAHYGAWNDLMGRYTQPPLFVLLDCPPEALVARARSKGQSADAPPLEARLRAFEAETLPLCEQLASQGQLLVVDGLQAPNAVFASIAEALGATA
jgi:UMP-CMP kinase